ncbi:MAG: hypothetical protein KC940_21660 [Candidatus Omnitrophica bacterium]|nr:hypothetical protein [Candidatus Omnitrophota bacterium]MCA9433140.1 hypothetical protein [Candidatus Omnitrophota bacterium]MCB9767181.1 hypothetical protein [Candidatus Omnitrophota bacterium]MCB9781449.1 hypothetical protein [Candidatus Omnitrophota bacterium]MCB9784761.1 hypothetical protein [Candidatus Omnitrophota bacterium]
MKKNRGKKSDKQKILEGIARGEAAIREGRTKTHSEAKSALSKWFDESLESRPRRITMKPMSEMRGFLKGMNTEFEREDDRF